MMFWIGYVISFVLGCLVCAFLFVRHYRRYSSLYKEQSRQLEVRKQALREIMRRTHHEDINPVAKRIRGLSLLGSSGAARIMNYCDQLSNPMHPEYSTSAMMEASDLADYFRKIESEALSLEKSTLDKVKEFEHLQ